MLNSYNLKLIIMLYNNSECLVLKMFFKLSGKSMTLYFNNVLKTSANLTEIFRWNWLLVISISPFIEHISNR